MKKEFLIKRIDFFDKEIKSLNNRLSSLKSMQEKIEQEIVDLQNELKHQSVVVGENPEYAFSFANYYQINKSDQTAKQNKINELAEEMELLQQEIVDQNIELKKYEKLLQKYEKEAQAKIDKEEMKKLDDFALRVKYTLDVK